MDLRNYYRKIREARAGIPEEWPVLVSRATPEGGRAGVLLEASREVAARMMVEGTAELATPQQATAFREQLRRMQAEEEARRAAARIQVNVITEADARKIGHKTEKNLKR